jgi:hypothetical protein
LFIRLIVCDPATGTSKFVTRHIFQFCVTLGNGDVVPEEEPFEVRVVHAVGEGLAPPTSKIRELPAAEPTYPALVDRIPKPLLFWLAGPLWTLCAEIAAVSFELNFM